MSGRRDPASLGGVLTSWLSALVALPAALVTVVVGQGLGAVAGGCEWIGVSLPIGRQPWALVNQPEIAFASQPRALGYWLGAFVLAFVIAPCALQLSRRASSLAGHLWAVQTTWSLAVVVFAWLPVLDPGDGHLSRFLALWGLPPALLWVPLILAIPLAFPATIRLLALLRAARPHVGRLLRLLVVFLHLGVPVAAWTVVTAAARGAPPIFSSVALSLPLLTALSVAYFGYPPAFPHRLAELRPAAAIRLAVAAVGLIGLLVVAGRPLGDGTFAGVMWGTPKATNNIRPWIIPLKLPGSGIGRATLGIIPRTTPADGRSRADFPRLEETETRS